MEEVDNIIIHSLRQIGCDIEDDVDCLKQFSPELVVEAAVRCLRIIQPQLELPHSLPPSMSARFRLGANLAQTCTELGYTGEIGYQTFLYSNEADVRRVLMFLIEKLPKEAEKRILEPTGRIEILEKEVSEVLRKQLNSSWLPSYCWKRGIRWREDGSWSREGCGHYRPFISCNLNFSKTGSLKSDDFQAWCEYVVHHLPLVTDEVAYRWQLLPSLITMNEKLLISSKNRATVNDSTINKQIPQHVMECLTHELDKHLQLNMILPSTDICVDQQKKRDPDLEEDLRETLQKSEDSCIEQPQDNPLLLGAVPDVPIKKKEEELLEEAKEEVEILKEKIKELQLVNKKLTGKFTQVTEKIPGEEKILRDLEERYAVKKRTYDLLPEADANISKLQSLVENSAQKLVGLAAQWEKHRAPLLEQYRSAKEQNSNKVSESQKQADSVRTLTEKARELSEEIKSKEQIHAQLVSEYETISKDTKRSAYTRRILEIIGNIRKQKEEIDKVLNDTRELQKEINNLTGRLDRSFTDADERIFRDAKKDEVARKAYKLLATLHSDCGELVQMVEETGAIVREIRDLEEQIDIESAKNVGANLERVSADLKQMKQENAALTVQLKSKLQSHNMKTV